MPVLLPLFIYLASLALLAGGCTNHQDGKAATSSSGNEDIRNEMNSSELQDTLTPDSITEKNFLLGKFIPAIHPQFQKIPGTLTSIKEGYLQKGTLDAFAKMHRAARAEGIQLTIVSATRTFDEQKVIWEAKWNGTRKVDGIDLRTVKDPVERASRILRYSSMPGTSRHHWGTDIDINSVDPEYFDTDQGKKVYAWLNLHAPGFGFCQVYTPKDSLRPTGYEEEPWHWSWLPAASGALERYVATIRVQDITGFQGDQTAGPLNVIGNYVKGIHPRCR